MAYDQGVIRRISWRDLFPWLVLFRTFRIAIAPTLLALAAAASILSFVGWRVAAFVFIPRQEGQSWFAAPAGDIPSAANSQLSTYHVPAAVSPYLPAAPNGYFVGYFQLAEPWKRLFQVDAQFTLSDAAYYAFGTLWTLILWTFVGGVITRRAVVQLGAEEPVGIVPAVKFASRRYLGYFLAPLYPLLGVFVLAIPIAILGLPLRLGQFDNFQWLEGVGAILAGLLWIFVVVAGLGAMWLLGGLIFGWPLMWPAISAERDGDAFEAFSRSFSYVYGKPLHYFFYVVVAALFGALCVAVIAGAEALVIEFGFWALSLGGGSEGTVRLRDLVLSPRQLPDDQQWLQYGAMLIGIVIALVHQLAFAFNFTYFWCASSAIYLLLRMDVDHQEMDEVVLDDDPGRGPALTTPTAAVESKVEATPVVEPSGQAAAENAADGDAAE
jgi:hypothetical protein